MGYIPTSSTFRSGGQLVAMISAWKVANHVYHEGKYTLCGISRHSTSGASLAALDIDEGCMKVAIVLVGVLQNESLQSHIALNLAHSVFRFFVWTSLHASIATNCKSSVIHDAQPAYK